MTRDKLFRDPVHDLITLDLETPAGRLMLDLIDCPEFQRLRRIRQLGMAHLAFHGAEHSRFTHSIGVMHLTERLLDRLTRGASLTERQGLAVRCAALLHDIGHGPFSHVIESFFSTHHEEWTVRVILSEETHIHRTLVRHVDREFPGEVVKVLRGEAQPPWVNRLVSGQLDVDRFDYLMRDSHMTGVKYGIYDLERLLLMLRVSSDGERIVVIPKGLLPIEKYLQSRYQMYRQVYFHKTVTAAEAMLMSVLRRAGDLLISQGTCFGVSAGSPFERVLAGNGDMSVGDYLQLDDSVILGALNTWSLCPDAILSDLSIRLLGRRLFKSLEIANYDEQDLEIKMRIGDAEAVIRSAGLDPLYYLLYSRSEDTPYRPYNPRSLDAGDTIWIQDEADPEVLRDVKDASPTIRAFTESPYTIWRVFFPDLVGGRSLRQEMTSAFNG